MKRVVVHIDRLVIEGLPGQTVDRLDRTAHLFERDRRVAARDGLVDDGGAVDDVFEHDGHALADVLRRQITEELLASRRELDRHGRLRLLG